MWHGDIIYRQQDAIYKKMSAVGYVDKVPESVQEENEAKAVKLAAELQTIEKATSNFERLLNLSCRSMRALGCHYLCYCVAYPGLF